MENRKFITYYRVSTKEQMLSHLSIEKQQQDCLEFCNRKGVVIREFTESKSASKKNVERPVLKEAIALCESEGATLVIHRLDRMSRRMVFISSLLESNVKFIALDIGEQDEFTTHIFAASAQREAKMISQRIRDAFAAKRLRGETLKRPKSIKNLTRAGRIAGGKAMQMKAKQNKNNILATAMIKAMIKCQLQEIVNKLNEEGFKTAEGKEFSLMQVSRLKSRLRNEARREGRAS
jgi:DNA invertase Pin-like site-specific DNA recombinase